MCLYCNKIETKNYPNGFLRNKLWLKMKGKSCFGGGGLHKPFSQSNIRYRIFVWNVIFQKKKWTNSVDFLLQFVSRNKFCRKSSNIGLNWKGFITFVWRNSIDNSVDIMRNTAIFTMFYNEHVSKWNQDELKIPIFTFPDIRNHNRKQTVSNSERASSFPYELMEHSNQYKHKYIYKWMNTNI